MKPVLATRSIGRMIEKTKGSRSRKVTWLVLAGVGALLLVVGTLTHHAVEETINDNLTVGLQTILQANIEALRIVVDNEMGKIKSWARDADVRILTEQLLTGQDQDHARSKLTEILANVLTEEGYLGYLIIDPKGVVLATDQPDPYLGKALSPMVMEHLGPVLANGTSFEKPFAKSALFKEPTDVGSRPVMLAKAPIPDREGNNIAALIFTIDPEKDFTRILSVAEFGRTGSTYAFDAQGVMLSESRHEEQLKELALIPDTPDSTAILTLQLRDPGVDLTKGKRIALPVTSRPLTHMVQAALNGKSGVDIDGYRDYRGVEVVGAWQWLDDFGFGVATEVTRSEALRSLRPVRLAFVGLFSMLVIVAGTFLVTGYFFSRLQNQVEELRELGQYTLVEKIGEGGMGKVYKARHTLLRRPTAIKLIRDDQIDETALERFEQEVQLTSQLTHPNTISIYDYGHSADGVFYYAMEYLSGMTITQLTRIEQQVPAERVIYILQQICGSLTEAHEQGLIHRDIKPGNIMLCQRGGEYDFVKVLDFGLVKEITSHAQTDNGQQLGIMGTPGFIAPELLIGDRQVDCRSDLYAVGAIGFLMLTGQPLFVPKDIDTMLREIISCDPSRPSQSTDRQIPMELDDLILACLSRNPEERPASARELAEKLGLIPLAKTWTQRDAADWWQANADRIAFERKLERPKDSSESLTIMGVDFGDRS